MWCAASNCKRHLAVNNGVRRQISDSGAIRSIAVPNVKIPRGSVAFWHNAIVQAALAASSYRAGTWQAPADHRGLDHAAGSVIAPLTIDPAAGEGQLIGSAVILAKNFHGLVGRRISVPVELRQPLFTRCHTINLQCYGRLRRAAKSIHR